MIYEFTAALITKFKQLLKERQSFKKNKNNPKENLLTKNINLSDNFVFTKKKKEYINASNNLKKTKLKSPYCKVLLIIAYCNYELDLNFAIVYYISKY